MAMSTVNGLYSNFAAGSTGSARGRAKSNSSGKVEEKEKSSEAEQPKLSKAAQKLLDRLKQTYSNMDFMVADFKDDEEARDILSRGTKEFSVLFSSDELEKMAADESYEKECMGKIEDAMQMSKKIMASSKDSGQGEVTRVGISFNKDGSVTYFAELEKASARQKERIEEAREKRAEERRETARREREDYKKNDEPIKRTTVEASSAEELIRKISEVDWSKVGEMAGAGRFDLSI